MVEQSRVQRSVRGAMGGEEEQEEQEVTRARKEIDAEKAQYKAKFATLRELKADIERLTAMLEQSRKKLTGDFEAWLTVMLRQQAHGEVRAVGAHARHRAHQRHRAGRHLLIPELRRRDRLGEPRRPLWCRSSHRRGRVRRSLKWRRRRRAPVRRRF